MIDSMVFDYKKHKDWASHLQIVLQIGLTMVGSIALCFFAGWYLDQWLGTPGVLMVVFTILGVIGGAVTVYRQIQEILFSEKQNSEKQP